ncbi:MAG: nuclear transport factor 2 family protein [Alphaproteobacteria bacterium]|nr:nuclear transport factor 2 family protein [Alphaproteobacteria bacterium]
MSRDADDVLAANAAFYAAFRERDANAMDRVWAERVPITCSHPGWPTPLLGRDQVLASWRAILGHGGNPGVRSAAEDVRLFGLLAVVLCEEHLETGVLLATNIFVKEGGAWRLIHHQSCPTGRGPGEGPAQDEPPDEEPPRRLH